LELSWASFARFLLPKMALGAFWGCLWLVLGAPEGLLRVVLASVKPISTIKTALPSFDTLFYLVVAVLVVVEYIIILIIIIVVLIDFAELQLCQTVHLESLLFFKPLIFPRKVISRQIGTLCCWLVFLWPAG
jgi:hypothetical protein